MMRLTLILLDRSRGSIGCRLGLLPWTPVTALPGFRKTRQLDLPRSYKKENANGPMNLSKLIEERSRRALRMQSAIQEKHLKIMEMEHVFSAKKAKLTSTGKQIRAKGKLIMQDIRETKNRMKEKMEEVIEKENVYTIPNLLCMTRILCSPLLGYFIVSDYFGYALCFMAVAGLSDWVRLKPELTVLPMDGYIARNYSKQSSKIGSFLDPMADKVLIGTLFISLTYVHLIPVPLTALILGRDVILMTAGFVIRYQSIPPPKTLSRYFDVTLPTAQLAPTLISKVNTGVQLLLVGSTLAAPVFDFVDHPILHGLWYVTAVSTVLAAASYILSRETYRYLRPKKRFKWKR